MAMLLLYTIIEWMKEAKKKKIAIIYLIIK